MSTKQIPLSKKMLAIVDSDNYDVLIKYKWQAHKEKNGYYATTSIKQVNGKYKQFRMHRMILGITNPNVKVDHKSGNTLDNTKNNLRIATESENASNLHGLLKNNTSGYRGVSFSKRHKANPWMGRIKKDGKLKHLGYFKSAEDAAKAFDKAAKDLFGEFCGKLNFD